jgi:hypothetical protein
MDFSFDSFAACLDQSFGLQAGDYRDELVLIAAEQLAHQSEGDNQAPFSIVFQSRRTEVLPQRMYRLSNDQLGEFDLFIVPIARDDTGVRYEAVFS